LQFEIVFPRCLQFGMADIRLSDHYVAFIFAPRTNLKTDQTSLFKYHIFRANANQRYSKIYAKKTVIANGKVTCQISVEIINKAYQSSKYSDVGPFISI